MKEEVVPKNIIREFIGLRPKVYHLRMEGKMKTTCKGIKRKTKDALTTQEFKTALFGDNKILEKSFYTITNKNHQLFTTKQTKISLNAMDSKRFVLNDNVNTLAHGHYKIEK